MNYCVYLKKRKNKPFCKLIYEEITLSQCQECDNKAYKKRPIFSKNSAKTYYKNDEKHNYCAILSNNHQIRQSPLSKEKSPHRNGKMKTKSNKLVKLERNRKSIFTDDLEHCYICGKSKDHLHELFFGRNRLVSIKFNFVIPVCSICHHRCHFDTDIISFYRKECQSYYEKNIGSRDEFIAEFKRNYLD